MNLAAYSLDLLTNDSRFQIGIQSSRDKLSSTRFVEEGALRRLPATVRL